MRIPSGTTDQYIYFVAVDATDLKTRETGLSSFTVYYSKNGGAATQIGSPTVNETDSTNMPGVYELLLSAGTTLAAGNDTEELCLHITHASMAPVTRVIELYRPETTLGNTLDVTATGAAGIDWGNVENQGTSVDLSATSINLCDTTTTNTDMRGTDSALLASSAPTNFGDLAITVTTGRVTVGTNADKTGYSISGSKTTLDALNDIAATDIVSGGNVIDVTAGGCVGIDWANIENPTTAVDLSGTDIQLVDTCTTNTDMRGTDSALLAASAPTNFSDLSITVTTGRVDVGSWLGTAVTTSSTSAKPEIDVYSVSDDAAAANDLELFIEALGTDDKVLVSTDNAASDLSDQVPPNVNACGLEAKINYLYGALIYRCHVDSDSKDFYNAADTLCWTKALSDDGTDYNEADASS